MPETPADTMRRAAAWLGTYPVMDDRYDIPLAALLEVAARHWDAGFLCCDHGPDSCSEVVAPALKAARAILDGEARL